MRVGIIFFGLPRHTSVTLPSIKKYILEALEGHTVFIESCLSLQDSIANERSAEFTHLDATNYEFFKQYPHQFVPPNLLLNNYLHAELLKFGDKWADDGQSLNNLMMQLQCIKNAYINCKQHDCDIYLFVRPDLIIHEPIPIQLFIKKYAHKNAILLPSWQWHGGVNDRFAIATKVSAEIYGLRYDQVLAYCTNKQKPLHSESFLRYLLSLHQVKIKTCQTKMSRVRVIGPIKDEIFSCVMRMGGFKNAFYAQMNQLVLLDRILGLLKVTLRYVAMQLKLTRRPW